MHLVQNWIRERRRQSGGIIQKGERNPCAPSLEEQPLEEASLQEDCESKAAWNLARKYASSSGTLNYVLFSLWRRQRHKRLYVYCVFGSFNAQCWARRFELRYNGYFEKVQKPHKRLTATEDSANKRVSTSFCSRFRSVRNSATTRWNASDSIALSALLQTRIFIWVENGETPQLAQNEKIMTWKMDNSVLLVASRLSSYSSRHFVFNIEMKGSVQLFSENWDRC